MLNDKTYHMPYEIEEIIAIISSSILSHILIKRHQVVVYASVYIIQEIELMNSIEGLKIKDEKDKIPTYKLCIIDKAHRRYFLYKQKHASII